MLKNVRLTIPYYIDRIGNLDSNDSAVKIFNSIDIVDKATIRKNLHIFIDKRLPFEIVKNQAKLENYSQREVKFEALGENFSVEFTSGTTGEPFFFIKDRTERAALGTSLWVSRNKIRKVRVNEFFDFIHLTAKDRDALNIPIGTNRRIENQINYLNENKFSWWHCNGAILSNLSQSNNQEDVQFPYLKIIENNGSYLSKSLIAEYEKFFQCRIVNNYGCREVWNIAYECLCGQLHVNNNILLELVDEDNNVITTPNTVGSVVITSLILKRMPIIRYKLGDYAKYVKGSCKCGNSNCIIEIIPVRENIANRQEDGNEIFRLILIRMLLDKGINDVESIEVDQMKDNEFKIHVRGKVKNRDFFESSFHQEVQNLLGGNYKIDYIYNLKTENKNRKSLFINHLEKRN